jgi:hypothetical protein
MNKIEWDTLAQPRSDGYDTEIVLQMAKSTTTPRRPLPYTRRNVAEKNCIFGGNVAVRYVVSSCPYSSPFTNGPLHHPNIYEADRLAKYWPEAYEQFGRLIDSFHPIWNSAIPEEQANNYPISCSGCDEAMFGTIYATVHHPLMLAEAFVHELAHQKLYAMGVSFETADRMVRNLPEQLYRSPVILDRLRPMTAVLHAEYAFTHMSELNIRIYEMATEYDSRPLVMQLLRENVRRIHAGLEEIESNIHLDAEGMQFFSGLKKWVLDVILRGRAIIDSSTHGDV